MKPKSNFLHWLFEGSLLLRGIYDCIEILGGVFILAWRSASTSTAVQAIFQHELTQDPHDLLVNYLLLAADKISVGTKIFAGMYLLIDGIIKLGLIIALWRNKAWAYPLSGIFFSLLVLYEMYRFSITHSIILILLILVDIVIIFLLWSEWRRRNNLKINS